MPSLRGLEAWVWASRSEVGVQVGVGLEVRSYVGEGVLPR